MVELQDHFQISRLDIVVALKFGLGSFLVESGLLPDPCDQFARSLVVDFIFCRGRIRLVGATGSSRFLK